MARPSAGRPRSPGLAISLGAVAQVLAVLMQASGPAAGSADTDVAALIADLGDPDYATRERAAAELEALGPSAADAVLSALETCTDLEVVLRAGWLVDALPAVPLAMAGDAPIAARLLEHYDRADEGSRRRLAHRLLRVDDDAGIEPLARIVRLDRSPPLSRLAAALLVREWRPGDPFWGGMAPRITRGLGASQRLAARFVRAVVGFSGASSPADAAAALADAVAVVELLEQPDGGADDADPPDDLPFALPPAAGDAATQLVFRRCLVEMLAASGRRDEALGQAALLLAAAGDEDARSAAELVWLCEHGLPEAVGILEDRVADPGPDDPALGYAMALACRRGGRPERATELADHASARPTGAADESLQRLQVAVLLAKWGATDWARREYDRVVAQDDAPAAEAVLGSIYYSEFLHDQGDDAGAATVLRRVVDGEGERAADRVLPRLERDPEAVESRLLYFEALAAEEPARSRELLERAVAINDRDVDSLIALYRLEPATPDERAATAERVRNALRRIENEIEALPDDPNGYNEYAWLVSNTEGNLEKATRFSRLSLEKSFDTASYLDTLAHCHAAAGDLRRAIRAQSLALRMEPHSRMILQNLLRFHALAGDATTPARP